MDPLPPNDPNRNNNGNNRPHHSKEDPSSGRNNGRNGNGPRLNERGELEVFGSGNVGDDILVAALFLIGTAAYLLRERCVC
mmetsp:Transcript_22269/g.32535  ORF Transcript_22269/g.32535 Transcript_22269/m.32535 type:complete len:81 (+) Transcript_22269:105-347(+)